VYTPTATGDVAVANSYGAPTFSDSADLAPSNSVSPEGFGYSVSLSVAISGELQLAVGYYNTSEYTTDIPVITV
jgi:hypothetical protein